MPKMHSVMNQATRRLPQTCGSNMADACHLFSFAACAEHVPGEDAVNTGGHHVYGRQSMVGDGTAADLSNGGNGSVWVHFLTNTASVKCEHQVLTRTAACLSPRGLQG